MPQMAPMNWLILFLLFIIMNYMLMNLIYFNFIKNNINSFPLKNKNYKNYNKFI